MKTFILLFRCKDKKGIVAKITDYIFECGGNIIAADQHSTDPQGGYFFMRVEFTIDEKNKSAAAVKEGIKLIARGLKAEFSLVDKNSLLRMGLCVSRPGHCLAEILYLWRSKELLVDIPVVISNFEGHRELVKQYKIPFVFIAATKNNRREAELLKLVSGTTDFLVLSRYMLVLSPKFLKNYSKDIINIHHGLLPSFKGKNPHQQALKSGVKVIGATSHFVTKKLDAGPIIAQEVEALTHKDNLRDLVRKGKNLEKRALTDAIRAYIDRRIIKHNNKTIVF